MVDPAEDIAALYERHAGAWDRARGSGAFEERPWIDAFATHVPSGGAILDIGCGSGAPIARHLVACGFRISGVDTSISLIELCRSRMPSEEWIVADMRELELGARFDGVLAWHSFFHLAPDAQRGMFPVFARHCRPGSALMFTSGDRDGEAIGSFEGDALYHASLAPEEYQSLLARAEFRVIIDGRAVTEAAGARLWFAVRA